MDWKKLVYYDETSPTGLRWKIEIRCGKGHNRVLRSVGDVAGVSTGKRAQVRIGEKVYQASRIVLELMGIEIPEGQVVDHIDGNIKNNSIQNLRVVTESTNRQNCKKRSDNKTGITGVVDRTDSKGRDFFVAIWKENGKARSKWFSKNKYGEICFELAVRHRAKMIEYLNSQGQQYTERHGK